MTTLAPFSVIPRLEPEVKSHFFQEFDHHRGWDLIEESLPATNQRRHIYCSRISWNESHPQTCNLWKVNYHSGDTVKAASVKFYDSCRLWCGQFGVWLLWPHLSGLKPCWLVVHRTATHSSYVKKSTPTSFRWESFTMMTPWHRSDFRSRGTIFLSRQNGLNLDNQNHRTVENRFGISTVYSCAGKYSYFVICGSFGKSFGKQIRIYYTFNVFIDMFYNKNRWSPREDSETRKCHFHCSLSKIKLLSRMVVFF